MSIVVAVDGPSGSGKSTVSRRVAERLGLAYLDTGAMFRAVTWYAGHRGIGLADTGAVADLARSMTLTMVVDPRDPRVWAGGIDVTAAIRESAVSTAVSAVATNLDVRAELARRQRSEIASQCEPGSWADGRGIVVEGRDITTVIAPDADVRLLLTASEQARLARRAREVHGTDDAAAVEATRDQVVRRDQDDSTVAQFLTAADGVVTVDSSDLDLDQTVDAVLHVVEQVVGRHP